MEGYLGDEYDEYQEEFIPYPEEDDEGVFEEAIKTRVIEDPSPVNKIEPIPAGASFIIFSEDNALRIFCHWLQGHPIMGNFILVCILVSSALKKYDLKMLLVTPREQKSSSSVQNVQKLSLKLVN